MKVNIKGLVFTGFAAAILSANAMAAPAAGDNIVTSKSYVDAKIASGTTADSLSESTTVAPNQTQVINALATKQPIQNTADYKVGQSSGWQPLNSAVAVASNGYLAKTDNSDGSVTLNIDTASQLQTDGSSLSSGSGKLITEGAVAAAIAANGGAVNTGVLTVTQNSVSQGTFNANDSTSPTIAIVAPSWDATNTEAGYIAAKPDIRNAATYIDSADGSNAKELPTTYAVQQYVDAVESALDARVDALESTDAQADWTETDTTAFSYIQNKPTLGAAAPKDVDASVSSSNSTSTNLPTTAAVYDYVQSQTGGTVIPARDDTICTDSTPCALVYETDGAHWRTMATATDTTGGACGDAAGTGCRVQG